MERKIVLKKELLDTFKTIGVETRQDFVQIDQAFKAGCPVAKAVLGNGTVTFMRQRELVDFAVRWIEENRK